MGRDASGRNGVPGPGEPSLAEPVQEAPGQEGAPPEAGAAQVAAAGEAEQGEASPGGEGAVAAGPQGPLETGGEAGDWKEQVEVLRDELARVRQQFERAIAQRDEALEQLARLKAEFDSYRRRAQAEMEAMRLRANEALLLRLLPVLDNLERAVAAARSAPGAEAADQGAAHAASLIAGVQMVINQFQAVLEQEGVRPIPSVGEPFDPNRHEAVLQVEAEDGQDGLIVEELQRGYLLGDKVLRPSMVKVARSRAGSEASGCE